MFLVEYATLDNDHYEVVFASYPSDFEIVLFAESHDWLAEELAAGALSWNVSFVNFIDNTPDIEITFEQDTLPESTDKD